MNLKNRTIFCRDNLDILQGINSECIDLIYLDPPFNKNKKFTAPIGTSAEGASFKDIFREEDVKEEWLLTIKENQPKLYQFLNGVKGVGNHYNFAYLAYMAIRLLECYRILKKTGGVYLHCDPTMSHYLKIIMDCVFGEKSFRNEITWKRHSSFARGSQYPPKTWGNTTDIILFYANPKATLKPYKTMTKQEIVEQFPCVDEHGERYYDDSSHIWRTPNMGARPNLCYEWRGFKNPHPSGWRLSKERMEEEFKKGNFVIHEGGKLQRRKYERDYKGKLVGNLWTDITHTLGRERIGYPTQKPLALLERIIKASSDEGDVVLDPFCGCATGCIAAERLNRQWIGIDISIKAYELVKERLADEVNFGNILFKDAHKIPCFTSPPKRTDLEKDYREKKFVYVISNPKSPNEYKVGIAQNWKARLNSYQIGDPDRGYQIEFKFETPLFRETEKHIHETFQNKLEWVQGDLNTIIDEIKSFNTKSNGS